MNTYRGTITVYTSSPPLSTSPAAHLGVTIRRNSEHDVTGGVAGSGAEVRCTRVTSQSDARVVLWVVAAVSELCIVHTKVPTRCIRTLRLFEKPTHTVWTCNAWSPSAKFTVIVPFLEPVQGADKDPSCEEHSGTVQPKTRRRSRINVTAPQHDADIVVYWTDVPLFSVRVLMH